MNIQWYPGHMAKTKRLIMEDISLVDIIIELLDARIPISSKNPDIDVMGQNKHRIVVLNKSDLADERANNLWKDYYESKGFSVVLADSTKGKGFNEITAISKALMAEKVERLRARGRIFVPTRAMIAGIPNVGKSTLINKYAGKSMAKTGDRPGVTRSKQWVKIKKDFELLDTPGILWPKFEDPEVGLKLAFTGAVKDEIMDIYTLSLKLIDLLKNIYPDVIRERYGIEYEADERPDVILEKIGEKRLFKLKGNDIDLNRTAIILIDEFRGGKLGRLTLETPLINAG